MSRLIYIVHAGDYEDFHVIGVWSTPEAARAQIDREDVYPMYLQVWDLDSIHAVSFEGFEEDPEVARQAREAAAQALYDAKAARYGTPAGGPQWMDRMANRFRKGRS